MISKNASLYGDIVISPKSRIDDFVVMSGNIKIGNHVHIACHCSLIGDIVMEDFSGLSGGVRLYAKSDDYSGNYMTNPTVPTQLTNVKSAPIHIGRHAIIGANSVIMPGVKIGEGAAVGAGSFITQDVEPWSIVIGKGEIIKTRSNKLLVLEKNAIIGH